MGVLFLNFGLELFYECEESTRWIRLAQVIFYGDVGACLSDGIRQKVADHDMGWL